MAIEPGNPLLASLTESLGLTHCRAFTLRAGIDECVTLVSEHYVQESTLVAGCTHVVLLDIVEASEMHADKLRKRFAGLDYIHVAHARSTDAAATYTDCSVDVVYIDADHSYEAVAADIDAWRRKVRPGGFIGGHDYHDGFPGVKRAVDERLTLWATFCDSSWLARVT